MQLQHGLPVYYNLKGVSFIAFEFATHSLREISGDAYAIWLAIKGNCFDMDDKVRCLRGQDY